MGKKSACDGNAGWESITSTFRPRKPPQRLILSSLNLWPECTDWLCPTEDPSADPGELPGWLYFMVKGALMPAQVLKSWKIPFTMKKLVVPSRTLILPIHLRIQDSWSHSMVPWKFSYFVLPPPILLPLLSRFSLSPSFFPPYFSPFFSPSFHPACLSAFLHFSLFLTHIGIFHYLEVAYSRWYISHNNLESWAAPVRISFD